MKQLAPLSALALALLGSSALAAPALQVTVEQIADGKPIPERYALCKATPDGKSTGGENQRPTISWSGAPQGTKSYALIVSDPDVPADFSKAGKDGQVIAADEPRQNFYHWALLDIPAAQTQIPGGDATKAPAFGKAASNDLGSYLPDPKNYGGPCPPWNDARLHHYHFKIYALDSATLDLPANPTAKTAEAALTASKHVLAKGETVGTYTLNAAQRKP